MSLRKLRSGSIQLTLGPLPDKSRSRTIREGINTYLSILLRLLSFTTCIIPLLPCAIAGEIATVVIFGQFRPRAPSLASPSCAATLRSSRDATDAVPCRSAFFPEVAPRWSNVAPRDTGLSIITRTALAMNVS